MKKNVKIAQDASVKNEYPIDKMNRTESELITLIADIGNVELMEKFTSFQDSLSHVIKDLSSGIRKNTHKHIEKQIEKELFDTISSNNLKWTQLLMFINTNVAEGVSDFSISAKDHSLEISSLVKFISIFKKRKTLIIPLNDK